MTTQCNTNQKPEAIFPTDQIPPSPLNTPKAYPQEQYKYGNIFNTQPGPKTPLVNFLHHNQLTFQQYEDLQEFKLSQSHPLKKEWLKLKDDIRRIREKHFERKFNLPNLYLRGIHKKKPTGITYKDYSRMIAIDYEKQDLELSIRSIVSQIIQEEAELNTQKINHHISETYFNLEMQVYSHLHKLRSDILGDNHSSPDTALNPDLKSKKDPTPVEKHDIEIHENPSYEITFEPNVVKN